MQRIYKQVLVLRDDAGMNRGKIAAQSAHAALGAFLPREKTVLTPQPDGSVKLEAVISAEAAAWYQDTSTKAVVKVMSEKELHDIYQQAQAAGLPCMLIQDAGFTHFTEPTYTAVGIGPAPKEAIDAITGHLSLLR